MGLSSIVRDIEYKKPNCEGCGLRRKGVEEAVQPALALCLESASAHKKRLLWPSLVHQETALWLGAKGS